jgi:hypothetical protein
MEDITQSPQTQFLPKSTALWWVIAAACVSVLFSLGMFAWQIANDTEERSGKVVTVSTTTLSIIDGRGRSTMVSLTPATEIRGRVTAIVPGQFVLVIGTKRESGEFAAERIQILERRPRTPEQKVVGEEIMP